MSTSAWTPVANNTASAWTPVATPPPQGPSGAAGFALGAAKGLASQVASPAIALAPGLSDGLGKYLLDKLAPASGAEETGDWAAQAATLVPAVIADPAAAIIGAAGGSVGSAAGAALAPHFGISPERGALIGGMVGALAGAHGGAKAREVAGNVIKEAAMEDPDMAALKALNVGPDTRAASRTLENIKIARPYLKGVQTQDQLQQAIPTAKDEVWAPRQAVIDHYGDLNIQGPNGLTTVRQLEERRAQLAAINQGLKNAVTAPEALRQAEQMGLTKAKVIQEERDTNAVLDRFIEDQGVHSQQVRRTYSALKDLQARTQGRLGGMEKSPMGLGKVVQGARVGGGVGESGEFRGHGAFLTEPIVRFGQAARDIAAGRGLFSGSPADISVREGFRTGGPKPDLGTPKFVPMSRMLGPGATVMGSGQGESYVRGVPAEATYGRTPKTGKFKRVYTSNPKGGQ